MKDANADLVAFEVAEPAVPEIAGEHFSGLAGAAGQIAKVDFAAVTESIAVLIEQMATRLRPRPGGPAQCEVQFGVKVTAEGSLIVSKLGGEVSMTIKVVWDRT